ncbi:hypothetical protein KDA14_04930, partial [Candidatus Saccharibacteria bacterium]|nr:hypothetical protein [Candidatus Saccharibacteria bacterium]
MTDLLVPPQASESLANSNYADAFATAGAALYDTRGRGWRSIGRTRFEYIVGRDVFSPELPEELPEEVAAEIAALGLRSMRALYIRRDSDMRPWQHPGDFETPPVWIKATLNTPEEMALGESFVSHADNAGNRIQAHFPRVPEKTVPRADLVQAAEILQA